MITGFPRENNQQTGVRSQCVNTTTSRLSEGKFWGVLCKVLQGVSRGIELPVPRAVSKSVTFIGLSSNLSLILPTPSLLLPGIFSHSNHLYTSPCLKSCFGGTYIKTLATNSGYRTLWVGYWDWKIHLIWQEPYCWGLSRKRVSCQKPR